MTIVKRYFARVGSERVALDAEHVELQKKGAHFGTSAPVRQYEVEATVDGAVVLGFGKTWKAAEDDLDAQIGKKP